MITVTNYMPIICMKMNSCSNVQRLEEQMRQKMLVSVNAVKMSVIRTSPKLMQICYLQVLQMWSFTLFRILLFQDKSIYGFSSLM